VLVHLPRAVHLAGEPRLVHGVRVVLRLQAHPAVLGVDGAALAHVALEEVAGVELQPGLVPPQLHHAAGVRLAHHHHLAHPLPVRRAVEHEVDVVPALHLRDARAWRRGGPEVEGRPGDGRDGARRDEAAADRRHRGREDLDGVAKDGAVAVAAEVPVRVLREVHGGGLVERPGVHGDAVGEVAVDLVGDEHVQGAREPLLAVVAAVGEGDVRELAGDALADGPEHLVEPAVAAVERVVAVVPERVVGAVPDGEAPAGDAVRHATHQRAEVGRVVLEFFFPIKYTALTISLQLATRKKVITMRGILTT
jgi:hypothetical protein